MKKSDDAAVIARRIAEFLYDYAPQFLTNSECTLKGYKDALTLYFLFLQENRVTPDSLPRQHLERGVDRKMDRMAERKPWEFP